MTIAGVLNLSTYHVSAFNNSVNNLSVALCFSDSQINNSVVRPVNPSSGLLDSKGSQMLMVEVLRSLRKVPVLGAVTQPPAPTTISQKIVLQPVQTALGVQYYRRPNGKLVRLVPVSQLRSGNPSLPLQRGESCRPSRAL